MGRFAVRDYSGRFREWADGRIHYWKYTGAETIRIGKMLNPPHNYTPTTDEGIADVQKMQIATWGRVGY